MEKKGHDGPYEQAAKAGSGTGRVDVAPRRGSTPFPYDDMDAGELLHFITRVLKGGDLVSITATSDGGALSITITCDGTRFRCFAKDGNELLTATTDLLDKVYGS